MSDKQKTFRGSGRVDVTVHGELVQFDTTGTFQLDAPTARELAHWLLAQLAPAARDGVQHEPWCHTVDTECNCGAERKP